MARVKEQKNGRLEEAMALLIQNQAAFIAEKRETDKELADLRRENFKEMAELRRESVDLQRKNDERFARSSDRSTFR